MQPEPASPSAPSGFLARLLPVRPGEGLLVALAVLWPLWQGAGVQPGALFDPNNLHVIGGFLAGFLHPVTTPTFLARVGQATLETLAMSALGTLIAAVLGLALALPAARTHA